MVSERCIVVVCLTKCYDVVIVKMYLGRNSATSRLEQYSSMSGWVYDLINEW